MEMISDKVNHTETSARKWCTRFGWTVVVTLLVKIPLKGYGYFVLLPQVQRGEVAADVTQLYEKIGIITTVILAVALGRTAYGTAKSLKWPGWQLWLATIGCLLLPFVSWIFYFIFRSKLKENH